MKNRCELFSTVYRYSSCYDLVHLSMVTVVAIALTFLSRDNNISADTFWQCTEAIPNMTDSISNLRQFSARRTTESSDYDFKTVSSTT